MFLNQCLWDILLCAATELLCTTLLDSAGQSQRYHALLAEENTPFLRGNKHLLLFMFQQCYIQTVLEDNKIFFRNYGNV